MRCRSAASPPTRRQRDQPRLARPSTGPGVRPDAAPELGRRTDGPAQPGTTVLDFLAERATRTAGPDDGRPLLAVIDQFEDAFAGPAALADRDRLMAELAAAVAAVPAVRLLLVIRQDALPLLGRYPRLADLRPRVQALRPLDHDQAVQAVTGPADVAGVALASGVAEQLVSGLSAVRSVDQAGREVVAYTDGVEPLYLQLTGQRLLAARSAADEVS